MNALIDHVDDNNVGGVAEEDVEWTPEHGEVVVNALIAGIACMISFGDILYIPMIRMIPERQSTNNNGQ